MYTEKTQAPRLQQKRRARSARVVGKSDLDDPQDRLGNYFGDLQPSAARKSLASTSSRELVKFLRRFHE